MIRLSDNFTFKTLLRFTFPTIVMMIFTSVYGIVDGLFISNYARKTAFAAVNYIMPLGMILGTIGFMFGSGGAALVSKTLGEGEEDLAREYFTLITLVSFLTGAVVAAVCFVFMPEIAASIGATESMIGPCTVYGRILMIGLPFFILQYVFQSFLITDEKPKTGLYLTLAAGITNMVLDAVFVAGLKMGLEGAAAATVAGQFIGGFIPLFLFRRKEGGAGSLYFVRTGFYPRALLKACSNGLSELMTNVSASLVSILYNLQLLKYAGEDGVAAYGVIMYAAFIFQAVFYGYTMGVSPVISYQYGRGNREELAGLFRRSLVLVAVFSLGSYALTEVFASPIAKIFVGYDQALFVMTRHGFRIYAFSFLLCGFAIFASGFFTALNNGPVSAAIAFLRTLVFQVAAVLFLPPLFGLEGIWFSVVVAEFFAVLVSAAFFLLKRKQYGY